MHRIDGAGHVNNKFVAEDPATNRPPTEITESWMNTIQEEIAGFIEWAGGVLNKANNGQLQQYLLAKFCRAEQTDNVITGAGLVVDHNDQTLLRQAIAKMIQAGQHSVIFENVTFAGAVTGAGKAVYWDSANSRYDLALADGSAKQDCIGFADVPNACIYAFGKAPIFSGLTPGRYYLSAVTAGAITPTAPANAVFVGLAKSATEVFVDVDSAPQTVTTTSDPTFADNSTKTASTGWIRGAMSALAETSGFVVSWGPIGYIKAPSWFKGFIFEWGTGTYSNGNTVTFPAAFPTNCYGVLCSCDQIGSGGVETTGPYNIGLSQFAIASNQIAMNGAVTNISNTHWWCAFGR